MSHFRRNERVQLVNPIDEPRQYVVINSDNETTTMQDVKDYRIVTVLTRNVKTVD